MRRNKSVIGIILVTSIIFISACILYISHTVNIFNQKEKSVSITTIQDYDPSLCSSLAAIGDGNNRLGLKLQAYDAGLMEIISTARGYYSFQPQNLRTSSLYNDKLTCYAIDRASDVSVSVTAEGYTPIEDVNIGSLPTGKMYLIQVAMNPEDILEKYSNNHPLGIKEGFGLNSSQYTLGSVDSKFERGGFMKAKGEFMGGGKFELFYHLGWMAPSGADSGWTKCFAVEGNDEIFNTVKNNLCNEISSEGLNYDKPDSICFTPGLSNYNNNSGVRQKCLEGEYEYSIGNKKVISIIQNASHCSSSVEKGISDCWSIQSHE